MIIRCVCRHCNARERGGIIVTVVVMSVVLRLALVFCFFLFSFTKAGAAVLSDSSSSEGGDSDSGGEAQDHQMDTATELLNQVLSNKQKCVICGKYPHQALPPFDFGYADVNCYYCYSTLC